MGLHHQMGVPGLQPPPEAVALTSPDTRLPQISAKQVLLQLEWPVEANITYISATLLLQHLNQIATTRHETATGLHTKAAARHHCSDAPCRVIFGLDGRRQGSIA